MKKLLALVGFVLALTSCSSMCDRCYYDTKPVYTVSQPVEVVYRRTTYKRVYVPKMVKETTYERVCVKQKICR